METSILRSIKGLLGPDSDYTVFDPDLIIFINSALSTLTQVGVGPKTGFRIEGEGEEWEDFLGDAENLDMVKNYVFMKVKILFDPPANSYLVTAYKESCEEIENRLKIATEFEKYT